MNKPDRKSDDANARTCLIATVGPASSDPAVLQHLVNAGADVFRLNFSHGEPEDHARNVASIRSLSSEFDRPVGILQDLRGPKLRIGRFPDGAIVLKEGQAFALHCDQSVEGSEEGVSVSYEGLCEDVGPGDVLMLDDGNRSLEVVGVSGRRIDTRVIVGGKLSNNKGINAPQVTLNIPALGEKDVEDLKLGAELGVDWVAMSFVRSRDDILLARHYLQRHKSNARLMAKIEKPTAVDDFDRILETVDGIMIARGDLGVELSPESVPMVQKRLVLAARMAGKPVVTATQMLESMIQNPRPTRAEASDVANAIFDGSDGVMLSAETAVGQYPVEAVRMMNRIALSVEKDPAFHQMANDLDLNAQPTTADAVASAACRMAQELDAKVIVSFSSSGATAQRVARHRVSAPILGITTSETSYRQLSLTWGVLGVLIDTDIEDSDEMVDQANQAILERGIAKPGDLYVVTAGVPFGVSGTTNLIRVETVRGAA